MSFETMKASELKEVAESFGVDLEEAKTKGEIIAALAEEGVTFDMYKQFSEAEKGDVEDVIDEDPFVAEPAKPAPKGKLSKNNVLVKMERKNYSYQTFGYTFTAEHPYVAVPEKDAQLIFDNEDGFRMATPREVQEFYS